jgi:gliding motility-associated-like protein
VPAANIVFGGSGGSRTVVVTPAANQSGTAQITITVGDGSANTSTSFDLTVSAVNDAPTISTIADQTIDEDLSTSALAMTVGDVDNPVNSLTLTGSSDNTSLVPNANIVFGGSGANRTVTVTPASNQSGVAVITVTVSDGTNQVSTTFQLTVNGSDDPPTISSIANQTINEDVPTGLLPFTVNDAETAAADLVVTGTSDNTSLIPDAYIVVSGTGANRNVQITPALNQSGIAIITLSVSDGVNSASTNFQVTVNTVNDAPTISAIADQVVNEDTSTDAIAFTIGDVETAPGSLTVTASSGNTVLIPNGNIVLGGSGANRTVQAAPAANQSGTAVITINVGDGVNTTSRNFQVTVNAVNDPATITPIADQTVNEDNPTAALAFTLSDPDTPVGALTLTGTSDNTALVPNANIVFAGSGGSRTVTVTPVSNQSGTAVITVTVNDGTNDTPTSFQLNVTAVNDAPVIADQIPVSTNEEQPFDVEFSDLVVTDPDNTYPDDFTLEVLGNPGYTFSGATVTPNANVTGNMVVRVRVSDGTAQSNIFNLQVTVNAINDPPVITAQNPSPLIVNEDGSVTVQLSHLTIVDPDNNSGFTLTLADGANYSISGNVVTPDANYNGTLSVPVTVSDGTATSASFPLQIQVNPINDVPQITGQASITIAEVQPVALDLSQLTVFDPDNDYPDDFTLAILSGPNYSITGNTVIPVPNFSGTLLVRVFVNDGVANSAIYNLQISVNSTNDAPVITGQNPLSTDEGEPITITINDVTVNDPDNTYPDDFTLIILPGPKYTFSGNVVTPNQDVEGVISVSVKVNDGEVDSAPYNLQLTINGINNAPVITGQQPLTTPEEFPITLKLADLIVTDPDSPFPTGFTMTASPGENYTIAGLTVTPAIDFNGSLSVPVTVSDGQLTSAVFNLEVVVSPVNDPPVINGHQPLSTLEDQAIVLKLADLNVTDVDNTFPTGFTLTVPAGSGATYTVSGTTVTPVANFIGALSVPVVVSDGTLSTSGTVEITVESVNDAPTLNVINNVTIQEDPIEQFIVALSGISSGPGEASQTVTVTASTNKPEWFEKFEVQYSGGATGSLAIKPKPNQFGTASITVRVQDNGPNSPVPNVNFFERTFNFIIEPVNDPPAITSTPLTIAETDQEYSYLIVAQDIEGEEITFGAPVLPPWLSLSQNANGSATLTGTPPPGTTGQIAVILQVKDPAEGSITTQEFQITVNSRPVISSFAIATDEEVTYTLGSEFAANFTDADANTLSEVEITRLPVNGTLTLNGAAVTLNQKISAAQIGNLELKYSPLKDATGMDTLSWNGSDGIFYSNTAQNVFITIRPVNDPPEIIALEAPESDTLKYELGSERPIQLTRIFDAIDADGDDIMSAQISFSVPQEYYTLEDQFIFKDTLGIIGQFDQTLGILTLNGRASVANYVAAIRSIKYNLIVAPIESRANVGDNRRVSIKLSDGIAFGGTKERLIGLTNTFQELDIATAFTPTGANPVWNIYSPNGLEQYKDAIIRVYNKRGTLVYEARGFSVPWNGDGPEGALPADSYFYTIDLKYDKKKYKGVVTILR